MLRSLEDHIVLLKGVVTHNLCDAIVAEYKDSSEWGSAPIESGVNQDIRNCTTIGMSFQDVIEKNKHVRLALDKYMHVSVTEIISKYRGMFPTCAISYDTGYNLLRYKEGDFYKQHIDSFTSTPRAVSCSIALNDGFEGGEFAFFDRELMYKVEKGDALLFPSNFMYPHEVMPVIKGTRYSIVTWFI